MLRWLFGKKDLGPAPGSGSAATSDSAPASVTDNKKTDPAIAIAAQHQLAGRYTEAEKSLQAVLEADSENFVALRTLAALKLQMAQYDSAGELLFRAIAIRPLQPEAHSALGKVYLKTNRLEEAERSILRALELEPNLAEAHFLLGNLHRTRGKLDDALACFERAVSINPKYSEAHNNAGVIYEQRGQLSEAVAAYRKAVSINPRLENAQFNLGLLFRGIGNTAEALECLDKSIALNPKSVDAFNLKGLIHRERGELVEAIAAYKKAIDPNFSVGYSNYLFCLSHDENADPEQVFAEHCAFGNQYEAPFRAHWARHGNLADPNRKLRVGFVSADLYAHAVSSFIEPLWGALDSSLVEIWVYFNSPKEDAVTLRLKELAHQWRKVYTISDEALAQTIRDDKIDILFDLSGHTADNRLLTFARRPAPVQVTWIGNPNTTGLTAIDYYLADPAGAPPGMLDSLFTEKIVQLPSGALFQPFEPSPPVNKLPALTSRTLTFGSFARSDKLTAQVIRLWSRTLAAVPQSRMLLAGLSDQSRKDNIREQFDRNGVEASRLVFRPRTDMQAYLALHHEVDIILDTFPFSGGTTSCHGVWMGVPILTLAGKTMSSRVGAIINANIGLSNFTTESEEEFVALAVRWSRQLPALAELRASLRSKTLASPMCQPPIVARWLESALRTMWIRWCEGKTAQSFSVSAE